MSNIYNNIQNVYSRIKGLFYDHVVDFKEKKPFAACGVPIDDSAFKTPVPKRAYFKEKDLRNFLLNVNLGMPGQGHVIGFSGFASRLKTERDIPADKYLTLPVCKIPIKKLEETFQECSFK